MAVHNPTKLTANPQDREIVITRIFDAPRELVFNVLSDPKLIPQWWGPARYSTKVDKMDFRSGGSWRFVQKDDEGHEYGFRGEYREVVPPERVVDTFEFEPMPGHISIETMTLENLGGKTKLTVTSVFQSMEDRDGMLQSGMESGMSETYDRLDDVLEREAEKTTA